MLENEIINILRDPTLTMEQQAAMLAAMMRKRNREVYKYLKAQAQETIVREREESALACEDAFERGWDCGFEAGVEDREAGERAGTDIAF